MLYAFAEKLIKAGWEFKNGAWHNGKARDALTEQAIKYELGVWRVQEDPKHVRKEMEAAGVVKGNRQTR